MAQKIISGKVWLLLVVMVLVVAAVVLIERGHKRQPVTQTPANQQAQQKPDNTAAPTAKPAVVAAPLTTTQITASLPSGFPSEEGAKVLASQQQVDSQTKQVKIIRTTTTSKDLAAAFSVYTNWLNKNNWILKNPVDTATLKAITGDKGGNELTIVVSFDGGSKSNIVVATYTTPGK